MRCGEAGGSTPCDMCTTPVVSSTVTNCGPVAWMSRSVRPEARQDQRVLAGDQMRAVELGRDLHGQPAALEGLGGVVRVGRGRQEVAAHADEDLDAAVVHRLESLRRCRGRVARRRIEVELLCPALSGIPGLIFSQMPIVRSPCTLLWPRTGHRPAPRPADLPAQQREVDDLLDVGDAVLVLREAHRPGADHPLGRRWRSRAASRISVARDAALLDDRVPGLGVEGRRRRRRSLRCAAR